MRSQLISTLFKGQPLFLDSISSYFLTSNRKPLHLGCLLYPSPSPEPHPVFISSHPACRSWAAMAQDFCQKASAGGQLLLPIPWTPGPKGHSHQYKGYNRWEGRKICYRELKLDLILILSVNHSFKRCNTSQR